MRGARGSTGGGEGAVRGFWEGAREEQASRCVCACVRRKRPEEAAPGKAKREAESDGREDAVSGKKPKLEDVVSEDTK